MGKVIDGHPDISANVTAGGKHMKRNCWEFKDCRSKKDCPAFSEYRLNGEHGGVNAGRSCWVVAGTFCSEKIQGKFAQEISSCRQCDFYQFVYEEEKDDFKVSAILWPKLDKGAC